MWEERLFIPGPTTVPAEILAAGARQTTDHRGAGFSALYASVRSASAQLAGAADAAILPASGTGGLEAVAHSLLRPGMRVLAPVAGAFGERFARLAELRGAQVEQMAFPWGAPIAPDAVVARAKAGKFDAVLLTQNETSTGVLHPVDQVADQLAGGPLLLLDAISGFPSVPLHVEGRYDAAVACSQKGFMAPPGLALVLFSRRGKAALESASPHSLYFDLRPYLRGDLPYTPAVTLIAALGESLRLLDEEGEARRTARHHLLGRMARAAGSALGLTPLADPAHASPTVTALSPPEGISVVALRAKAREEGAVLAGGQGEWKAKVLRIGHVGSIQPLDLLGAIGALEVALWSLGHHAADGRGALAALSTWREERQIAAGGQA
ncbi:MAG: alanine--glyoxylate aminotransferase family protein [Thermaerobacter sp.]|nr:alanine--glyoxylate aminotransferase family protein [Thermaerobacter sp.]